MEFNTVLAILLGTMFINNIVTYFGFGNVALGENSKIRSFVVISCVVFSISLLLSSTSSYFLNIYVFKKYNLEDFSILANVLVSILCIFLSGLVVYKNSLKNFFYLKDNTYIITFTASVVGGVIYSIEKAKSIPELFIYILGISLGFILMNSILHCFSGYARRNMKGFTLYIFNLLTMAVISIIIMNFTGLM